MDHHATFLGIHRAKHGQILDVTATADNRSYVLHTKDRAPKDRIRRQRLIFREEVVLEENLFSDMRWALSYDGEKLAVAKQDAEGHTAVWVNGTCYQSTEMSVIHDLEWIGSDRWICTGWNEPDEHDLLTFINGERFAGKIEVGPILIERHLPAVVVEENGQRYLVTDDGRRTDLPTRVNGERLTDCDGIWPEHTVPYPEEASDEETRRVRAVFRGEVGEEFDEIQNTNGTPFVYGPHDEKVGYIGIRYPGLAGALSQFMGRSIEKAEEIEHKKGKAPLWAGPFALLFSPYVGPVYRFMEWRKLFFPVDGTRVWKRGFPYAHDPFFTPDGRLVVTVSQDRRSCSVAVDEKVGPRFDYVYNVRCLPDGTVCYLAISKNKIYRVVAQ